MHPNDVAIVGLSLKLPQEAENEESFWRVLQEGKNLMSEWPSSRLNIEAFYDKLGKRNKLYSRGGHFLREDPALFDAPFFSITPKEAMAMDPQQRRVLETSYHAFENAGISMNDLKGSRTGVFEASMSDDFNKMQAKDPDDTPRMVGTGSAWSIIPNRVSWYFDIRGPSIHLDTACSSSLIAIHLACQSILSGDSSMALVVGSNLLLGPDVSLLLSNQKFLSPDSLCYSFDSRANGYARGEGVAALILKPVSAAIQDGNLIRAVIRSTGSNQDGRTPGLTQPSMEAQESLIRDCYAKAGLDLDATRYVEAHGTGTAVGDPIEMKAISTVFESRCTPEKPLYVGSVKSNIGHVEACSGIAGIIKAVMILEKGVIPPNALFEKLNPSIHIDEEKIKIPVENTIWPTQGLRRVSVNSFGFGGTNAHVILDDAYHYLNEKGLKGHHNTRPSPTCSNEDSYRHGGLDVENNERGLSSSPVSQILVWTAPNAEALDRVITAYRNYHSKDLARSADPFHLMRLAHTLMKRTHMSWRAFAVMQAGQQDVVGEVQVSRASRALSDVGVAFVFTGQGAQYSSMGLELIRYPIFKATLQRIDAIHRELGCPWSIFDELSRTDHIDEPQYSQPLCTSLQVALIELLASFHTTPSIVVGHSSGEIAAAYSIGALSMESACKLSYYRGQLAGKLKTLAPGNSPGSMVSVNLTVDQARSYMSRVARATDPICVACENSPVNCTLSGTEEAIGKLKETLDRDGIFAQILSTGLAYHSPAMSHIASEYKELIGELEPGDTCAPTRMISTVTGEIISHSSLRTSQYWVDNLVNVVKFTSAMRSLVEGPSIPEKHATITDIIEIGPHCTLRRPIRENLGKETQIQYHSVLHRMKQPIHAMIQLCGELFCRGYPVCLPAVNGQGVPKESESVPTLVDYPEYPFDHSQRFWSEPRLSRDYRLREYQDSEILGWRFHDWNPLDPRWRNFLTKESPSWVSDHVVSNTILFPAAGTLAMALEAVKQTCPPNSDISGFYIRKATFMSPIIISQLESERTETMVNLTPLKRPYEKDWSWSQVKIFARVNDEWRETFRASIQVRYKKQTQPLDGQNETQLSVERIASSFADADRRCGTPIKREEFYEYCTDHSLKYGNSFRLLWNIRWDGVNTAIAHIIPGPGHTGSSLVHPPILDNAFQLLLAQASKGLTESISTLVPYRIFNTWVSACNWPQQHETIRVLAHINDRPNDRGLEGSVDIVADNGLPLCRIQNIVMVGIASSKPTSSAQSRLLYNINWKPQLSMLDLQQLHNLVDYRPSPSAAETHMKEFRSRLKPLLERVLRESHSTLLHSGLDAAPATLKKYVEWVDQYAKELIDKPTPGISPEESEAEFEAVESILPSYRLITTIARKLGLIISGEVDPLHLAFDNRFSDDFYDSYFKQFTDDRLEYLLGLMSHENPRLRILEVGAGTGGWTKHLLPIFKGFEERTGSSSFSSYTYTDISPAFFQRAQTQFDEARMDFKTFDLERDPGAQGFQPYSYDLVVAGSVLHATKDLDVSLQNIQQLLKPDGYLLIAEPTVPEDPMLNLVFGTLPSWWGFDDQWRNVYPIIDEPLWNEVLKGNGYTGVELALRDFDSDICHTTSVMLSRKRSTASVVPGLDVLLVLNQRSTLQVEVAQSLVNDIKSLCGRDVQTLSFGDDGKSEPIIDTQVVIFLVELDGPVFASMSDADFHCLKEMTKKSRRMLWVASTNTNESVYPFSYLMQGFLRALRSESLDKHIVQLQLDDCREDPSLYTTYISKTLYASFESRSPEVEYIVRDGQIKTGRLIEEIELDETMRTICSPQLRHEQLVPGVGPPLQLALGTRGILDTLHLIEDTEFQADLGPNFIEVEARAWGLNFRDLFIALGRLEDDDIGSDCAGVVTRIASSGMKSSIKPGDRVCFVAAGCWRTHGQMSAETVTKLPDTISFETAASIMCPGVTAYHSLVNIARLTRGEKVLIHSAAGGTGQTAIWIAKLLGAEIFATVGYEDKKQLLIHQFGINEDHIFYSRDTEFAEGIKPITNGYGVDVVLNSLSGDSLRASWDCTAPYGRFIEIGKTDITSDTSIPMGNFKKNVSFCAVDVDHLTKSKRSLVSEIQQEIINLVTRGSIEAPTPMHQYPLSKVEEAFRLFQSGRSAGRIVITSNSSDMVPTYTTRKTEWKFDQDASYLVAGGLGGLGRSIILWMADKGAKNLIIPSRSGISSQAAREVIGQLERRGVNVLTPTCDVSSMDSLSATLDQCSRTMPLVKGCVNASMVLQDALFENMTHDQWNLTIRSKALTSWNLHSLLPRSLDFFIQLSSMAGIVGAAAQSNYSAGCTFQDALARHRISMGLKGMSLDVGWMSDVGIVAETAAYQRHRRNAGDMQQIREVELLAVLDMCCDPAMAAMDHKSQLLIGVKTPAHRIMEGLGPIPKMEVPLFSGFSNVLGGIATGTGDEKAEDKALLFRQATSKKARAAVVTTALVARLAHALLVSIADVEETRSLTEYGVDSLMAVELRNWIDHDFQSKLAVFDIMSNRSIESIGHLVVERSEIKGQLEDGKGDGKEQ